jgi:hypothetical protein
MLSEKEASEQLSNLTHVDPVSGRLTFSSINLDVSVALAVEDVPGNSCRQGAQVSHETLVAGVQSKVKLQGLAVVEATAALLTHVLTLDLNVLL